jgi:integrase
MAWITKQRDQQGEIRHLVGWREPVCRHDGRHPEGDRIHESFRTAREAKARKREVEDQLERGTHVSKADRQRELGEYFDSRLADDIKKSHSTKNNNRLMFDKHIRPTLGGRSVNSIKGEHIRSVLAAIEGKSAQAKVYAILATTFHQAVADGLIVKTLIEPSTVERPKAKPKKRRIVTLHELYAILDAAVDRHRVPILVAATAGLRGEEIGGLRVGDIDFERCELRVRQTVVDGEGGPVIGPPKTDSSEREVPVDPRLIGAIQQHLEVYGPADDGRIFTTNEGPRDPQHRPPRRRLPQGVEASRDRARPQWPGARAPQAPAPRRKPHDPARGVDQRRCRTTSATRVRRKRSTHTGT